jgi:acyl-CoA synthetase (AMP-forming)/AMP-acid ligase II
MAPDLLAELEDLFAAPLIEAYGMTEAAHQMASNPLPPGGRVPGSVGLPTGVEVAIMGLDGDLLPAGQVGEIIIRGPNVTRGYERNPEANATNFADGWFRTGDQGAFDPDGYLFIHGRIKELINRGGEKISPREVDEVLMAHPDVAQAMAFALPDPRLGEEVGAVVVLEAGAEVNQSDLLRFAADRLASFKLPRHIVFLDDLPKGPTGKPQRIGLAERLGLEAAGATATPSAGAVPPSTATERALVSLWSEVLKLDHVGIYDPFTSLGGDSMLAMLLLARVRDQMQVELSMLEFFEADTASAQAALIDHKRAG